MPAQSNWTTFRGVRIWTGTYKEYLKTKHWKTVRMYYLKRANFKCAICGKKATQVHHHSYKHLGDERDYEISVYCDKHHEMIHR